MLPLQIQSPSIGRIVHYQEGVILPAVVISVLDHESFQCRLAILGPDVTRYLDVPYSPNYKPGFWSWGPLANA